VADARPGGSAGAVSLVLQAVIPALAVTRSDSRLRISGGTHMAWSPPVDYLQEVWAPMLAGLGITVAVELEDWGWFPLGHGCITARISGSEAVKGLLLEERGRLLRVSGRAVAANLPSHIPQRMAARAESLLRVAQISAQLRPVRVRAACAGAGIFLTAEYEACRAGFNAIGRVGRSSEEVAEEAVSTLLSHRDSGAALDVHLADQLLPILALADSPSSFTTERASRHLMTNAYVVERFGLARVAVDTAGPHARVRVVPAEPLPAGVRSSRVSSQESRP
jgi:RNA 3'-terminal phosphate cyclase (ATP)